MDNRLGKNSFIFPKKTLFGNKYKLVNIDTENVSMNGPNKGYIFSADPSINIGTSALSSQQMQSFRDLFIKTFKTIEKQDGN